MFKKNAKKKVKLKTVETTVTVKDPGSLGLRFKMPGKGVGQGYAVPQVMGFRAVGGSLGPIERAGGIKAGARVTAVNGKPTAGMAQQQFLAALGVRPCTVLFEQDVPAADKASTPTSLTAPKPDSGFRLRSHVTAYESDGTPVLPEDPKGGFKPEEHGIPLAVETLASSVGGKGVLSEVSTRPARDDAHRLGEGREATVARMAEYLGIDPEHEPQLLGVAEECLDARLPAGMQAFVNAAGCVLYYHRATGTVRKDHPADEYFKRLAKRNRKLLYAKAHHVKNSLLAYFARWQGYVVLVQRQREAKRLDAARIRVAANWARMRVRACVAAWKRYTKTAKADRAHERRLFARAAEFFRAGSVRAYFERWCGFVDRAYSDRKATRRAVLLWQHAVLARIWRAWQAHTWPVKIDSHRALSHIGAQSGGTDPHRTLSSSGQIPAPSY